VCIIVSYRELTCTWLASAAANCADNC